MGLQLHPTATDPVRGNNMGVLDTGNTGLISNKTYRPFISLYEPESFPIAIQSIPIVPAQSIPIAPNPLQ
jgi:hypothetical protein